MQADTPPIVVTIILNTPYMAIGDHVSPTFNLMELLDIEPKTPFWAWVGGEWCLHQSHNRWEVIPEQRLLYRTRYLSTDSCLGIAKEIERQPRAHTTKENLLKRKCEQTISPPSKSVKQAPRSTPHNTVPGSSATSQPSARSSISLSEQDFPSPSISPPPHDPMHTFSMCSSIPKSEQNFKLPLRAKSGSRRSANFGRLKWPHEFFVIDIIEGLEDYERRIKGDQSQPEAFLTVFGVPCVRETLRQKKTFLQNIQAYDNELLNQFINLGRVHSARWAFLESLVTGSQLRGKTRLELLAQWADSDSDIDT